MEHDLAGPRAADDEAVELVSAGSQFHQHCNNGSCIGKNQDSLVSGGNLLLLGSRQSVGGGGACFGRAQYNGIGVCGAGACDGGAQSSGGSGSGGGG